MLDPWIMTNPKTPAEYKDYDKSGKIDLILVSHAHFDHPADAPALGPSATKVMILRPGEKLKF